MNCLTTLLSLVAIQALASDDWQDTSQKTTAHTHTLKVNPNGKFVIAQLGDIMNNGIAGDYIRTSGIIENIVQNVKPDLIVITGDTVDPAKSAQFEELHQQTLQFINQAGIPWVWTGGSPIEGLSRDQVLGIDQEINFQNSWSGYKWDAYHENSRFTMEELGYFTSRIPVMDYTGEHEVFSVYAFDSEHWKCADDLELPGTNCIGSNAISWFERQQIQHSHKYHMRDLLFTHQPLQEFMYAANVREVYGVKSQAIDCEAINSGLFSAALTNKKTAWISSGGDPYNDFMTIYHDIRLSTARQTGHEFGHMTRGARVFEINANDKAHVHIKSFSVDGEGRHDPGYAIRYPPTFSWGYQLQCSVDPYSGSFWQ